MVLPRLVELDELFGDELVQDLPLFRVHVLSVVDYPDSLENVPEAGLDPRLLNHGQRADNAKVKQLVKNADFLLLVVAPDVRNHLAGFSLALLVGKRVLDDRQEPCRELFEVNQ